MLYILVMGRGGNTNFEEQDKELLASEVNIVSVEQLFAEQELTGIEVLDAAGPGWIAPGIKELLVTNGKDYSDNQQLDLNEYQHLPATAKQCFYNAASAAIDYPDQFTYVEGYAIPDSEINFPMAHAWVVDKNNCLLDSTWKNSGTAYYGIPFSNQLLSECLLITERYGIFDFLWSSKDLRKKLESTDFTIGSEHGN
jgi:hypothetical protein